MDFSKGQLVTPTLRLLRLLGRGGMGNVWLAEHLALQTHVAVKFLSSEFATSPEALARFQREATAAAQIRSPHVVQTLDHGLTRDGHPYIVLEQLEGEDLDARLSRERQLPLPLVVRVVTHTCKALAKAHSQQIVHRDIKPDNLFLVDVDGEPFIKVLDFGIAKKTDERSKKMTTTKAIIGTPYYMSPEQALTSRDVDHRADLWSLAVVAYQALTGKLPFDGETVGAICVAIDHAEFVPPSKLRGDLPPALDTWFARAFDRDIERRFGSAREMAETFAAAVGDAGASVTSTWTLVETAPQAQPDVPPTSTTMRPSEPGPTSAALPLRPRWPWVAGASAMVLGGLGALFATSQSMHTFLAPPARLVAGINAGPAPPLAPERLPSRAPSPASAVASSPPAAASSSPPPETARAGAAPASSREEGKTSRSSAERSRTSGHPRWYAPPPKPKVDRGF